MLAVPAERVDFKAACLMLQERKLRAYSRDGSPAHVAAVRQAFEKWVKKMWNDTVVTSTPLRPPQANLKSAAVPKAAASSQFQLPRQQLRESAAQISIDSNGARLEKKRKIQLDSIPE